MKIKHVLFAGAVLGAAILGVGMLGIGAASAGIGEMGGKKLYSSRQRGAPGRDVGELGVDLAAALDVAVVQLRQLQYLDLRSMQLLLQGRGVVVVGIFDPEEQEGLGQGYLEQLGVDLALPSTTTPEDLLFAVEQMQRTRILRTHVDVTGGNDEAVGADFTCRPAQDHLGRVLQLA